MIIGKCEGCFYYEAGFGFSQYYCPKACGRKAAREAEDQKFEDQKMRDLLYRVCAEGGEFDA